jgi:hypothetical protein
MKNTIQRSASTIAVFLALLATLTAARSQDPPRSGIYQIQSGLYIMIGGIWGELDMLVPDSYQAFISLETHPEQGEADLTFLDLNRRLSSTRLTNGVVSGNTIRFHYQTVNPMFPSMLQQVDYAITNTAGRLWISGSITSAPVCCDIPYWLEHKDVNATFMPVLSIRVADEVQLRWSSASNQNYQVQWAADLTQPGWNCLGTPAQGNGTTNDTVDTEAPMPPQRLYRILTLP